MAEQSEDQIDLIVSCLQDKGAATAISFNFLVQTSSIARQRMPGLPRQ
jgi:hypothetical protein